MASRFEINLCDNFSKFVPIDTQPSFVTSDINNIEDFNIFRPIGKVNEIIVSKQETPCLLEMILKNQDPKQKEIREKKRKAWRKFSKEINNEKIISYENIVDNRSNIVAQLVNV